MAKRPEYITLPRDISKQQAKQLKLAYKDEKQANRKIQKWLWRNAAALSIFIAKIFAQEAAKYTPPNMGKAYIEEKYYSRPIQDLKLLARGQYRRSHATKADYAALRAGYKFRILNTKHGVRRGTVFAYAKGINEAKRVARIKNRGLSRYTWGNALNNTVKDFQTLRELREQGQDGEVYTTSTLPPIFQRLQKKSPNIVKYQFAQVISNPYEGKGWVIIFKNKLAQIQRYGSIAITRGAAAVNRGWNRIVRIRLSKNSKEIQKIFQYIGTVRKVKQTN